jgi:RNA polymerase sigma-70 factor, ECF subfamily
MNDGPLNSPEEFVSKAFLKFRQRLIALARSRMVNRIQQKVDPEDVVQSAFRSFFQMNTEEEIRPGDNDDLWNFLAVITLRKCAKYGRLFSRHKRDLNREVSLNPKKDSIDETFDLPAVEPTVIEAAVMTETLESVMRDLGEREQSMLTMRLQGYSLDEISESTKRTERTVRRLLGRVRDRLTELSDSETEADSSE